MLRTQIRRHHHHRVPEIHRAALPVCQSTILEHLQQNIEDIKLIEENLLKKDSENKSNAETTAQTINNLKFTKEIAAKDNGELYGSLSVSDIVTFLSENSISIQKKSIKLGNKIKTTGEYSVEIDLHPEVDCSLSIEILSPKSSS